MRSMRQTSENIVFMWHYSSWCFYTSFLNTTDNASCFHIYLSPYFTNYDAIICKRGRFILTDLLFQWDLHSFCNFFDNEMGLPQNAA